MWCSAVLNRRPRVGLAVLCGHEPTGDGTPIGAPSASATLCFPHSRPRASQSMFGGDEPSADCAAETASASFAFRHLLAPYRTTQGIGPFQY